MKKGFTLVELIVVIIIIAILAAIAIPQFMRMQERAKGSAAKAKLDIIRKAEGIYRSLYDIYTNNFNALDDEVPEAAQARLNDDDWNFTLTNTTSTFTATATRRRGTYAGRTITIDQDGNIGGNHPSVGGSW